MLKRLAAQGIQNSADLLICVGGSVSASSHSWSLRVVCYINSSIFESLNVINCRYFIGDNFFLYFKIKTRKMDLILNTSELEYSISEY